MNDWLSLAFALAAGFLLGVMFFGGLWWTVRRGAASKRPASWFFGSMALRMSVALVGFYLVSAGHWQRLVFCLLGFVVTRIAVTWLTRAPHDIQTPRVLEGSHAP